jgi:hypothetical protein
MTAIFTGFFIIWLALSMWVYFDAMERGKAAMAWALSVFFLAPFVLLAPLVLYVIFRETGQRPVVPPGGARRQALYVVSFAGLGTLMVGLSLIVSATIARVLDQDAISDNDYREALASAIAAIVIGGVAWGSQWLRATPQLVSMTEDQEFRATFYLHRAYLYTVLGVAWVIAFITGLWFLGGGLANALDVEGIDPVSWLPALGPLIVSLFIIAGHYLLGLDTPRYKELNARFDVIPAPALIGGSTVAVADPAPQSPSTTAPSPPGQRFCTRCGRSVQPGDAFCAGCGAGLSPATG